MKLASFVSIVFYSTFSFSEELRPEAPDYRIIQNVLDTSLKEKTSKFTIIVTANSAWNNQDLLFSENGKQKKVRLNDNKSFDFLSEPGKHLLMFYLDSNFREIITDSILIGERNNLTLQLNFKSTSERLLVKKPVIYLYPETRKEVNIKLETKGKLIYTYPTYDNGWQVEVDPTGKVTCNDKSYNYLFWEAEQQINLSVFKEVDHCIVARGEIEKYLSSVCDRFGLSSEEKADFLTFWIPNMLQTNKKYFQVKFLFNDQCDSFAKLLITPKPNKIGRIYILWSALDGINAECKFQNKIEIPVLNREGFTVVEWGGMQIDSVDF